jgi:DNA-binding MarR family transcriptional regulator
MDTQKKTPLAFDPIAEARRHWEEHWGHELAPALTATTSIMRAQQILLAGLNGILRPYGLTFARYEALMLLTFSRRGSLSLGKIGARLQVHPTSVTNTIDRLEADGLVERVPHPSDRRATEAMLTAQGRRVGERATAALTEHFKLPLGEDELDEVTELIRRLRLGAGDFELDGSEVEEPAPVSS